MKKISIILLFFFLNVTFLHSKEFKLIRILDGLDSPWSLTFIDFNKVVLTEKSGDLLSVELENKTIKKIKHNLNVLEVGQGGLLDVLYLKGTIWVSYSEDRGQGKSSTSIAKGTYNDEEIKFENIFRAEPPINSGYHFGSRLAIKNNYLFASVGERGQGMIAQDPTQHPGSIIRIHLDGSIPEDNPKYKGKDNWLPEIYQIGVRNPQGMSLSLFDQKIYLSNHGAKGGDWFGTVNFGENYGWKILGWGGTNYSGTKIGPRWRPGFTKPIHYWVPSIAISAITIYKGKEFREWNGHALITSLKDQSLRKIIFSNNKSLSEDIIFKGKIGRIRDIKVEKKTGEIYLLSDEGSFWKLKK